MFGAYDLPNRSSAVTADTVRRLGYRPSRRVQIETVGRSRRRRHRGGTVEQDRARDERAAARAQFREPEPEPAAVAVAAPPAAPASESASDSGSEGFGEASGELGDISDFGDFLRGAQVYANDPVSFRDDPTEAAKADVSSVREESQQSARESAVAAADEEQTGEDYLDMVVTELEGKPLTPEQWYGTVITAIDQASPNLQLDALRTFTDYLVETKNDTDLSAEARRYFHDRWAEMPEIIIAAREKIEKQQRNRQIAAQLSPDDTQFRRRGSFQRSPSPIRTPGFEESGRFTDEASTVSAIRELRESLLADPRNDAEVAALRGELDATQSMLRDIQRADAGTRRDTIKALQDLGDASRRQIVKDRKLDPSEVSIVARNISDRPAVRELLSRGMVRPNDLVSEEYAAQLQRQADSARKLPQRRRSKQPMLTRQSVPSRKTSGLTYYRRAQHVRPSMFRQ
jgi:hypothetical protein